MKNQVFISSKRRKAEVNKNVYGHFAEHLGRCIYEGFWVGEDSPIPNVRGIRKDIIEALKALNIPVLRWPGGCFADNYHWRDGIGPRKNRKKTINIHWGNVIEDNQFGTHEFFDLCEMLNCDAYINANVGSGTVAEMRDWFEYMTYDGDSTLASERRKNGRKKPWDVKWFGIGNENWGCGGNMRPEFYADLYRQYRTYIRGDAKKIACGANDFDYNWTDVLMKTAAGHMDALSLHFYTLPTQNWSSKGKATNFPKEEWTRTLDRCKKMDEIIRGHCTIMDKYDPNKRVELLVDEWGTWYDVEEGTNPGFLYQQNSIRDACVAAVTFHIFHKHAERVTMANIAQTVNVLQAMILTDGEKMLRTPTYHVFEMFKHHQDAWTLDCIEQEMSEFVSSSVTKKNDTIFISLCNYGLDKTENIIFEHEDGNFVADSAEGYALIGNKTDDHNTFENPDKVKKNLFNGYKAEGGKITITAPPMSVITISLKV